MSVKSDRQFEEDHPEDIVRRDQMILKQFNDGVPVQQISVNQITSSQLNDSGLIHLTIRNELTRLTDLTRWRDIREGEIPSDDVLQVLIQRRTHDAWETAAHYQGSDGWEGLHDKYNFEDWPYWKPIIQIHH